MNKPTPGPWDKYGYAIIGASGSDDARVIALSAFGNVLPAPVFNPFNKEHRADTGLVQANAALIVAAVNACFKVNPDNPLAVPEALPELVEAAKELMAKFTEAKERGYSMSARQGEALCAALAKLEAK